jgi:hypothetical protein
MFLSREIVSGCYGIRGGINVTPTRYNTLIVYHVILKEKSVKILTIELSLVFRYASLHTDVLGNAGIVSHILNLGIRWKWAASLTL